MAYQALPESIKAGSTATWELQVAVWGEGKTVEVQVRSVRMQHRLEGREAWIDSPLTSGSPAIVQVGASRRLRYRFEVYAAPDSAGLRIESRFTLAVGDRHQVIEGMRPVPVVLP